MCKLIKYFLLLLVKMHSNIVDSGEIYCAIPVSIKRSCHRNTKNTLVKICIWHNIFMRPYLRDYMNIKNKSIFHAKKFDHLCK